MKKIFVWGTGNIAKNCLENLNYDKCEVIGFVETNPQKKQFLDRCVVSAGQIHNYFYDYLLIANQYENEISYEIQNMKICLNNVVYWSKLEQNIFLYSKDVYEMFSLEFLNKYFMKSSKKNIYNDVNKFTNIIDSYKKIYFIDINIERADISINKLCQIVIECAQNPQIELVFVPNEKKMNTFWYHNLICVLNKYAIVAWDELKSVLFELIVKYCKKISFERYDILFCNSFNIKNNNKSRYLIYDDNFDANEVQKTINTVKHINIYQLWSTRIGELIRRLNVIFYDETQKLDNDVMNIYIPIDEYGNLSVGANSCFTELIRKRLNLLLNEKEYYLWVENIFINPQKFTFYENIELTLLRKIAVNEMNQAIIDFSPEQLKLGEGLLEEKLNIKGEYVCVFTRDAQYLKSVLPNIDCSYHNYRDLPISYMNKSINYLEDNGVVSVRVGQITEKDLQLNTHVIDFPNTCYDEFLDIMLHRKCKFLLANVSGVIEISRFFGRPMAMIAMVYPLVDPFFTCKKEDLCIFNKIKSIDEDRVLSFKESFEHYYKFEVEYKFNFEYFKNNNLEIISHTPQDILDLTIEMNKKLDNVWKNEKDDERLISKFIDEVKTFLNEKKIDQDFYPQWKVSTLFLKKNRELL